MITSQEFHIKQSQLLFWVTSMIIWHQPLSNQNYPGSSPQKDSHSSWKCPSWTRVFCWTTSATTAQAPTPLLKLWMSTTQIMMLPLHFYLYKLPWLSGTVTCLSAFVSLAPKRLRDCCNVRMFVGVRACMFVCVHINIFLASNFVVCGVSLL